jgi:hypothetical protein
VHWPDPARLCGTIPPSPRYYSVIVEGGLISTQTDWGKAESRHVESPIMNDRFLAIRICLEISRTECEQPLKWAFLQSIEERLDLTEVDVQAAVRYGAEQGWLLLEGEPVHTVILCDAAAEIIEMRDPVDA